MRTPVRPPAAIVGLAALVLLSTPAPLLAAPVASSRSGADAVSAESGAGSFSMNLYQPGSFATQYTKKWCVAAALQIMVNIAGRKSDQSARTQERLFAYALRRSRYPAGGETSESGWVRSLNDLGYGPYVARATRTRSAAIHAAASAIRQTNRPAGLLTWWGAHAWVMHGFTATADPAKTKHFEVTSVFVSDPWYPKVSSIWGASLPPNSRMTLRELRVDYIPWVARSRRTPKYQGLFVLIVPVPKRKPTLGVGLAAAPSALAGAVGVPPGVHAAALRDGTGRWVA